MIPELNEFGYLPPGVHTATFDEMVERFGQGSDQRQAQAESLRWLVPLCLSGGIIRLIVNGSFVTDRSEPNDVDCALLQGPTYDPDSPAVAELWKGLPYLELKIVGLEDYNLFKDVIFAADRDMVPKGVVEVEL